VIDLHAFLDKAEAADVCVVSFTKAAMTATVTGPVAAAVAATMTATLTHSGSSAVTRRHRNRSAAAVTAFRDATVIASNVTMTATMITMTATMVVIVVAVAVAVIVIMPVAMAMAILLLLLELVHDMLRIKRIQTHKLRCGENSLDAGNDLGLVIVVSQGFPDLNSLLVVHNVHLIKQNAVCESDLPISLLIFSALALFEALEDALRVHERDGAIHAEVLCDFWSLLQGADDRYGIGHACGLDEYSIELVTSRHVLLPDGIEGAEQVTAYGAAHATVLHDHNLLGEIHGTVTALEELIIEGDFTELVLDNCDLLVALTLQQIIQDGGLARTQEASEDCNRHRLVRLALFGQLVVVRENARLHIADQHDLVSRLKVVQSPLMRWNHPSSGRIDQRAHTNASASVRALLFNSRGEVTTGPSVLLHLDASASEGTAFCCQL
jgi:hypothetical protein